MTKLKLTVLQKLIVLSILIEICFFYIFPLPSFFWYGNNGDNKSYILMILYLALAYLLVKSEFKVKISSAYKFISMYLIIQISIALVLVIRSKNLYSQSWFDMAMCADYLMFPIAAIVFLAAMKEEMDYQKMLYVIFWCIFVCQIVIFIQGMVYWVASVIIFRGMSSTGIPRIRGGMIRATWSTLTFIAYNYAFWVILEKKDQIVARKHALLMFIISTINLLLFCGTRANIFAQLFGVAVMYIFSKKIKISKKVFLVAFVAILLYGFGLNDKIMESFSLEGEYGGSTSVRLQELNYYIRQIRNDPLFGMGLIRPVRSDLILAYRGASRGTPNDVGLIGLLAETGLLGTGCFAILFFRGIYIIYKLKEDGNRIFLIGLIAYIIATFPTLIITNAARVYALPVCIAIFEGVYYRYKYNKVKVT